MCLSSFHDKDKVHFQDVANFWAVFQNRMEEKEKLLGKKISYVVGFFSWDFSDLGGL